MVTEQGHRIDISIGTLVQLEVPGMQGRVNSQLVGLEPGETVILKGWPGLSGSVVKLIRGKTLVARYLHAGSVFGFSSMVLLALATPRRLILLEYPDRVVEHNLRRHRRAACNLPVTVIEGAKRFAGIISDISNAGCRIQIFGLDPQTVFAVGATVQLETQFPGVPGVHQLTGEVRNTSADVQRHAIGVMLTTIEATATAAIAAYVEALGVDS